MIPLLLALQLAHAGVVATPPATPGATSQILLSDAQGAVKRGGTASAVTRPGLPGQAERGLGVTDARGRVRLTPEGSGVVVVRLDGRDVGAVHVAWPAPPASALVPLVLLGGLSLLGVLVGAGLVQLPAARRQAP